MVKIRNIELKKPNTRSWLFALIVSLVLGVAVLIDRGSLSAESGLAAPCRVEVTADGLTIHSSPEPTGSIVGTLRRGDLRGAETTVRNGYRELADGNWALDQALRPLPGSRCS